MTQVIETIDVAVPVRTAYDQWTQFESFPHFLSFVESITQTDDTHTHWKVKVAGVEREYDAEITGQTPDERVAWKSLGEEADNAGVVTFHRLSDAETRVTVQLDWNPQGIVEKAGAVLGIDNASIKNDLKNFKKFVEEHGAQGSWRGSV